MLWYVLSLSFTVMLTYLSKGRRKRKTHNTFENYIDEIDSEWKEQVTSMLQQEICERSKVIAEWAKEEQEKRAREREQKAMKEITATPKKKIRIDLQEE